MSNRGASELVMASSRGDHPSVICAVGARSARAAEFLMTHGVEAVNVAGGTKAWIGAGRPVETGEEPVA